MFVDAVRSLRAARGVTLFILFILTLTISVATVTFSVVDAVVLRPLPFDKPGGLAVIEYDRGDGVMQHVRSLSPFKFLAVKDRAGAFAAVAAVWRGSRAMPSDGEAARIPSAAVTASLFDVLGVRPLLGQTFSAAHEVAGNDRVTVISHALWRGRFGGDAGIVGRTLQMSDGPLLVLGVMPEHFSYPISDDRVPDLWTPFVIPDEERIKDESSYLHVVARVAPGTSMGQAQAMADSVRAGLAQAHPVRYERGRFVVTPLDEAVVGPTRGWMLLVLFAVGVLVLVACANVGNLLLTRALQRERELSIRASLGATRARLVGSLLIESLILSLSAVALSLVLASWGIEAVKAALPPGIARAHLIALDVRVFAAAVVAASVTGLLFGAFPALQGARVDLATSLKGARP
ncbi:MAG: ABC transporter permease [Vicinamibacterales bacterium]